MAGGAADLEEHLEDPDDAHMASSSGAVIGIPPGLAPASMLSSGQASQRVADPTRSEGRRQRPLHTVAARLSQTNEK